ncbi:MarR family transcriptional regulator [Verrucomicrobium sp. BvORR034]|uniref:MarR family winged helix-turn-helix transcriptional regulator n=1 Tax=Verrucomicrobium sp. BvORR034 TaxID=1396418 RepID=UPI0009DDB14B|nr:MarR family transcriptional regulator [Verrucomicrobium sp. BvORR034]
MKSRNPSTKKPGANDTDLATNLGDFLCFAVYASNLAFNRVYKPLFAELGLTYSQYAALVALKEEDGPTVSQLGKKLFLESSTLTPLLKRMEASGYVTRQRNPSDEREVRITLTDAGHGVFEKAFCGRNRVIAATGLTPDEFTRLQRDLVKLRNNLLKASQAGDA